MAIAVLIGADAGVGDDAGKGVGHDGLLPENWSSWDVSFTECEKEENGP